MNILKILKSAEKSLRNGWAKIENLCNPLDKMALGRGCTIWGSHEIKRKKEEKCTWARLFCLGLTQNQERKGRKRHLGEAVLSRAHMKSREKRKKKVEKGDRTQIRCVGV